MITIDPDEQEIGFDRFVHASKLDAAVALLNEIAAALGCRVDDHADLPGLVRDLALQRDRLRDAARASLGEVLRG
mgnify:CR=1 FL=1